MEARTPLGSVDSRTADAAPSCTRARSGPYDFGEPIYFPGFVDYNGNREPIDDSARLECIADYLERRTLSHEAFKQGDNYTSYDFLVTFARQKSFPGGGFTYVGDVTDFTSRYPAKADELDQVTHPGNGLNGRVPLGGSCISRIGQWNYDPTEPPAEFEDFPWRFAALVWVRLRGAGSAINFRSYDYGTTTFSGPLNGFLIGSLTTFPTAIGATYNNVPRSAFQYDNVNFQAPIIHHLSTSPMQKVEWELVDSSRPLFVKRSPRDENGYYAYIDYGDVLPEPGETITATVRAFDFYNTVGSTATIRWNVISG